MSVCVCVSVCVVYVRACVCVCVVYVRACVCVCRYYLIYIAMHLLTLVPAIYKAQMLGFVPYKSSHWMSILLSAQVPVEAQADVLSAF